MYPTSDELALERDFSTLSVSSTPSPKRANPALLQRATSELITDRYRVRPAASIAYHALPEHALTPEQLKGLTASLPFIVGSEKPHEYQIILGDRFHGVSTDSMGALHRAGCLGKFFITVAPHIIFELPENTFQQLCDYVFHHASTITCKNLTEVTDRIRKIFAQAKNLYCVDLTFAQCPEHIVTLLSKSITELTLSNVTFKNGEVEELARAVPDLKFLDLSGSEGITTQALSQVFTCCKALKKLVLTDCRVVVPSHGDEIEVITSHFLPPQMQPKVSHLGELDRVIFNQIEKCMQSIFTQFSMEVDGEWLRFSVGAAVQVDQLGQVLTQEMQTFVKKYKISCRVDFSFLRKGSFHPLTRFMKEICTSVHELVCIGSHCSIAPKNEPWHFHVLEKLSFHGCPIESLELQPFFCPKVRLLDVRRCSRLNVVDLPFLKQCQRVDVRGISLLPGQIVQILKVLPPTSVLDFTPAGGFESLPEESMLRLLAALGRVSYCPDAIYSSLEKTVPVTDENCIRYLKFAYEHALYELQSRCQHILEAKTQRLIEISFRKGVCSIDAGGIRVEQHGVQKAISPLLSQLSHYAPLTLVLSDGSAWLLSPLRESVGHLCFTGNIEALQDIILDPLSNLTHLTLRSCSRNFTPENLEWLLSMMPRLDSLTIESCRLTDTIFISFCKKQKTNIKKLELIHCKFLTNSSIEAISRGMPCLEELSLRACHQLTDGIFKKEFFILASLIHLDLSGTGITDYGLQYLLKSAHGLQSLSVANTAVSGRGFQSIDDRQFRSLKKVCLDACVNVTDEIVVSLGRMLPGVEDIELSQNANITQKALAQLIRTNPRIKTVTARNCRQIPAQLAEALTKVYPAQHSFELCVDSELTKEGIELFLQRHILAKSACFSQLSHLSEEHVRAIASFYQEKAVYMLKNLQLRHLRFIGATPHFRGLVGQFISLQDIVHTLWLETSIDKELLMLVPEFKNIRRLYVKNSCVLPGASPVDAETFSRLVQCSQIKLLHIEQMPGLDVRMLEFLATNLPQLRQLIVVDCVQIFEQNVEALARKRPGLECRYMRSQTMYQAKVDKTITRVEN